MKQNVYLVKCENYDESTVSTSLDELLSSMGGIEKFVKPGEKVFLKINLLMKKKPEEATTTHPSVVQAIVKKIQDAGGIVTIGDSPGGPYTVGMLKSVYTATGMVDVANNTGCELNYDISSKNVQFDGAVAKSFDIITPVMDFDKVIAVGKLKTHMLMTVTLAVKLCYGYIPGLIKADYHLRMPNPTDFANLLVDIYECRKPDLSIIDGVIGMEGDGPSAGTPIDVGCLFGGTNAHAIDTVGCEIMGISPLTVPTIKCASERGLFTGNINDVDIIGEKVENFKHNFKIPQIKRFDKKIADLPAPLAKFLDNRLKPKPIFISDKCKGCKDCEKCCPAKTISMIDNKAVVDLSKCIRCFCCHELCPHHAIKIKRPLLSKLLSK